MGVSPTETVKCRAVSVARKSVMRCGPTQSEHYAGLEWFASVSVYSSGPPRGRRGSVRFSQLLRALITADLDRLAANFDFDGIRIQLAVASRTSFLNHDIPLQYP